MAKINSFIATYTDTLQELDIPVGEGLPPKTVIRRFLRIFQKIEDSRIQAMTDYPLEEILLIAFLSVLGNASTWADMERLEKQNNAGSENFSF